MFSRRRKEEPEPKQRRLEDHAVTVEQILTALAVDPTRARMNVEGGFGWSFRRGSAVIEIYVTETEGRGYFQALSPLMHLPASGMLPLFRRLLTLNLQLTGASLGVYLDVVYLFHEIELEGLDSVQANRIINNLAAYADDLDDRLVSEFGGRLYSQVQ